MGAFRENAAGFPDARVVPVEGAGRLIPLEAPENFNRALRDFWT